MFRTSFPLTLSGIFLASSAVCAPVGAFSELDVFHTFTINSGNEPSGVSFSFAPALGLDQDAETTLDAPETEETEAPFTQVGNLGPPSLPYISRQDIVEQTPDGDHVAAASYDVNVRSEVDSDETPTNFVVERTVDTSGAASLTSTDGSVSGEAASRYSIDRFYTLTNTNADRIAFNIAGVFAAELLASYNGDDGFARTSLTYLLDIDAGTGVDVTYFPVAPYLRDITDADTGATVTESFTTSDTGFLLSVGTSAIGQGGSELATYDGGFRYVLGISMDPGASFILNDRVVQANDVAYTGDVPPAVPLPATLPLLAMTLGGLACLGMCRRV